MGGGAGTVINGLVVALLEKGHDVVVLADLGDEVYLRQWEQHHRDRSAKRTTTGTYPGKLHAFHVQQMLEEAQVPIPSSPSIFLQKSRSFAQALRWIYHHHVAFDIVECFDYAGVAFELLRTNVGVDVNAVDQTTGVGSYLPSTVGVAVRMHGSLQLIDQSEGRESPPDVITERSLMYLQEQMGYAGADLLFCQTSFMIPRIAEYYRVPEQRIQLAPPPLEAILDYVDEPFEQIKRTVPATWATSAAHHPTFLVYGRMQAVKGLDTIVLAALALLQSSSSSSDDDARRPYAAGVHFYFVGPDTRLVDDPDTWTSDYLKALIEPKELMSHFTFRTEPIDRLELARLSRHCYAAIFASQFETFNMVFFVGCGGGGVGGGRRMDPYS